MTNPRPYAHVGPTGAVVRVTLWDGETDYRDPEGLTLVPAPTDDGLTTFVSEGWTYADGGGFRPPRPGDGWTWDGTGWVAPPPTPEEWTEEYARVEQRRQAAYERDADPVFFRWQRGTATEQDWLNAVQAVKDAHPYPEPA